MKDSLRRLVLFIVIVGLGSAMIFVDIPLIYMLLLIVAVGFVLLIVLGTITVAEIKDAFSRLTPTNLQRRIGSAGFLKKTQTKPSVTKEEGGKKAEPYAVKKSAGHVGGIQAHLSLLVSSIGSLGKILSDRSKPKKKVEDIDKLLEHTITEKVTRSSALESASAVPAASGPAKGGGAGGALPSDNAKETDPFLSLSGEELETGLLDGLDEPELSTPPPSPLPSESPKPQEADTGLSMPDLEMPPLPDETAAEASAILAANAGEMSEETGGPEGGGEAISENLGDLDSINLDEIDLGDDSAMLEAPLEPAPPQQAGPAPGSGSLVPATPMTPAGAPDAGEDQSDISSFAAGTATGTDEDMLSSLATDIKQVKKENDVSLLRELKDFKAPATDIEKELSEITEQLNTAASKGAKKRSPSAQGTK
jgi:hypothetical protein